MPIDIMPVSARTQALTVVFAVGVPMLITAAALLMMRGDGALKWSLLIGALSAPVAFGLLWSMARSEVRLSGEALELKAGPYSTRVNLVDLNLDQATLVSPSERGGHDPSWRQNGIALPGYRAGWFKLKNGDRAFLLMTAPEGVALPTRRGTWLILSPRRPAEFLEALAAARA